MTPMPLPEQEMKGGEGGREGGGGLGRMADPATDRLQLHTACQKEGSARFCLRTSARLSKAFVKQTRQHAVI